MSRWYFIFDGKVTISLQFILFDIVIFIKSESWYLYFTSLRRSRIGSPSDPHNKLVCVRICEDNKISDITLIKNEQYTNSKIDSNMSLFPSKWNIKTESHSWLVLPESWNWYWIYRNITHRTQSGNHWIYMNMTHRNRSGKSYGHSPTVIEMMSIHEISMIFTNRSEC